MTFQQRCKQALRKGDLTVADLERWFRRSHTTVWRWVHSGWVPRGPDGRQAERDLGLLEKALALGDLFPVPSHVTSRLRADYVRNAYHAAERARLPQAGSAK